MQIAWIVYGSIAQATGGYVYDRRITEGLVSKGHRVDVISIAPGEDPRARIAGADAIVGDELCHREVGRLFRRSGRGPVARVLLVHHLTRWETDRAPSFATLVGEARALRHADAIVSTSNPTAERLAREGASAPIEIVEPGADRLAEIVRGAVRGHPEPSRGARPHRNERSFRFLFVGALGPRKNVLLLLDAFASAAARVPSIDLMVAGAPRDTDYARSIADKIAADPRLSARVSIAGEIDDAALSAALADADALVLPSSFEGYGMIAAEAIFSGVPVIASRTGALPEIVASGGMIVPPGDAAALTTALVRLAREPELRRALADRAKTHAASLPRWNVQTTRFEDAILRAHARAAR